ncbi:hypothetical protein KC952_00980 [Candidatus Saccharibacteria bacterium]|nr:hypothetical protein [Candidatus Saccharibacteria bacterium]
MIITKKLFVTLSAVLSITALVAATPSAYAALTDSTNLTQSITPGTLATLIGDTSGNEVATPSVGFTAKSVSGSTQTSTGTFGTSSERIYVDNPDGADNGWTLALASTGGYTSDWTSGGNHYPFNAATSSAGQLTIDPSVGTVTADVGTTTGVSKGSSGTYNHSGGTDSITLMTASAASDDIHKVYLTGVSMSQTIPAGTPSGSYAIDFTQTVTAS